MNDHFEDDARVSSGTTPATTPIISARVSRRAALRTWITRAAPLVLLTACIGQTSGASAGAATGGGTGTASNAAAGAAPGQSSSVPARDGQSGTRQASTGQAAQVPAASGPSGTVQQSLPACVITPQQSEGPYFVDERLNRSDIRSDPSDGSVREGIPLRLALQVTQVDGSACTPLAGTYVDLWQCDALGAYSDVNDRSSGSAKGTKFLRGYQVTDENGLVEFTTIFPGWYRGRAVHIHFKVRTALDASSGREMISQLYFDDALVDQVHTLPPYASRGQRDTPNSRDGLFRNGGDMLLVPVVQDGDGYAGTFNLGVQLT